MNNHLRMIQYNSNQFTVQRFDKEGDIKHCGPALIKPSSVKNRTQKSTNIIYE